MSRGPAFQNSRSTKLGDGDVSAKIEQQHPKSGSAEMETGSIYLIPLICRKRVKRSKFVLVIGSSDNYMIDTCLVATGF